MTKPSFDMDAALQALRDSKALTGMMAAHHAIDRVSHPGRA